MLWRAVLSLSGGLVFCPSHAVHNTALFLRDGDSVPPYHLTAVFRRISLGVTDELRLSVQANDRSQ